MKITITIDIAEALRSEMLEPLKALVCDLRGQGLEVSARLNDYPLDFFCDDELNDADFQDK